MAFERDLTHERAIAHPPTRGQRQQARGTGDRGRRRTEHAVAFSHSTTRCEFVQNENRGPAGAGPEEGAAQMTRTLERLGLLAVLGALGIVAPVAGANAATMP